VKKENKTKKKETLAQPFVSTWETARVLIAQPSIG
jgi:hypothetical protein